MPTPFFCHSCDKPTMNDNMICADCNQRYIEGDKAIFATVTALEERIKWLENGLNEIKATTKGLLDGNPTTADEHNHVYISDINKRISEDWNLAAGEVLAKNYEEEE